MIKINHILFIVCLFWGGFSFTQVDTFEYYGLDESRIIMAILGDGYTADELGKFKTDAGKIVSDVFKTTPFKEYRKFFNVYSISVESNESGADHPGTATDVTEPVFPVSNVDNAFGSTFDVANIHRLVAPSDNSAILSELANSVPSFDQTFIVVNSDEYGGSGGRFATSTTDENASEIAIHEIGHSFANLKDEYWAGDIYAGEAKNMTQESNPDQVKWKEWLGVDDIGIFPYGSSGLRAEWYRPHQNCKMRYLNVPFCRVCTEGIIDRIYDLADPIESFSPEAMELDLASTMSFEVEMVDPDVERYTKVWLANEDTIESGVVQIELTPESLPEGEHQVNFHLYDETNLSKSYLPSRGYFWSVSWQVTSSATTSAINKKAFQKFAYHIYPNPATRRIFLEYKNPELAIKDLEVSWLSVSGQAVSSNNYRLNAPHGKLELIKPDHAHPIQLLRLKDTKSGWHKSIILNQ